MRAALYIDCDSIEAKAVPVIYEDIIRTDKLVICKMFNSDKDDDSFVESAGRFRIQDCMHGEYKVSSAMVALAVEVMADAALSKPERIYIATGGQSDSTASRQAEAHGYRGCGCRSM